MSDQMRKLPDEASVGDCLRHFWECGYHGHIHLNEKSRYRPTDGAGISIRLDGYMCEPHFFGVSSNTYEGDEPTFEAALLNLIRQWNAAVEAKAKAAEPEKFSLQP